MSDEVVITMTAQEAQAVAAWQRITRATKENEDQLKRVARTAKEAGDAGKSAFQGMAGEAQEFLMGLGAISTVAGLFRREWDDIIARQERAADRQVNIAAAFRRAASVARELTPDSLFGQVSRVAAGQNQAADLLQTFEASTSAAGSAMSGQQILDAVLASAEQRPDLDQTARTALVTGALQLQKSFGGDIQTAVAAVQQSFGTSRAENLGAFAQNVIPTVTALRQMGGGKDSFQDLMGLAVGWGQATNDKTGERGRTDLMTIFRQAKEKAAGRKLVGADAGIMETLAAVQGDPKLRSELLGVFAQSTTGQSAASAKAKLKKGELTVGAASFVAGSELINGQGATPQAIREATAANLGLTPAALADIQKTQAAIRESRPLNAANLAEGRERIETGEDLNDSASIRAEARRTAAAAWARLPKGLQTPSNIGRRYVGGAIDEAMGLFQSDEQFVRGQANALANAQVMGGATNDAVMRLTGELIKAADKLAQGGKIEEVADLLREQNKLMQQPQAVRIEGDNRPLPPRRAPVNGAGD